MSAKILGAVKSNLCAGVAEAAKEKAAKHLCRTRVVRQVTLPAEAASGTALDTSILLDYPQIAGELVSAQFVPGAAMAESDTNLISLNISKGDLAGGALTAIGTAITTAATGQAGELVARTAKTWTLSATLATRQFTADQGIYLVVDETGTPDPSNLNVTVILEYDFDVGA